MMIRVIVRENICLVTKLTMRLKNVHLIPSVKLAFIIGLSFFFHACDKSVEEIYTYPNVDEQLQEYFKNFEEEGRKRGVKVDLIGSNVHGSLAKIEYNQILGLCNNNTTMVIIDQDFWASSSHLSKELIIFHELGHCYLKLAHNTIVNNNGICNSIMRPGNGDCLDYYNSRTREKMIDELFSH